jgi:hypothetical protein
MKTYLYPKLLLTILVLSILASTARAQCGSGYTRDTLNWDYLDFIPQSGKYVSPTAWVSLAQAQTQRFSFGTQKVVITHNYTGSNIGGDVTTHTGETGSYGKGADVRFVGNGTITVTFDKAVSNVKFSLYDIDNKQRVTVTAKNGLVPAIPTLSTLTGSMLSITNTIPLSPYAEASGSEAANNANTPSGNGTLNVDIAGPITTFTLTVSLTNTSGSEDGSFYLSDISACSEGSYPIDYFAVTKPMPNQPNYIMFCVNNTVYYMNPSNGVARKLFSDPSGKTLNSLAYDPYKKFVYYVYTLTSSSSTNKSIMRWDMEKDTLGVFVSNVNDIGIPSFDDGVENAGACFYNGSYYIGLEEAGASGNNSARESTIWRIDVDASNKATTAVQQFALPVDDGGGNRMHDWSDFSINNGILYDGNGAATSVPGFYHFDILTGSGRFVPPASGVVPNQFSMDWTGKIYNVGSGTSSTLYITPYDGNGGLVTAQRKVITYRGSNLTGTYGDGAEAFFPLLDFGDAPATFDPTGMEPAAHEWNDSIRLGAAVGLESSKKTSSNATGDGAEEDGIAAVQVIARGVSNHTLSVSVFNNTNRAATLLGWVDANGDGVFSASEGTSVTVNPSTSQQTVTLLWTGINVTLPAYATTFMRLRIATSDLNLSTSTPNGYADNGEVEDYVVTVSLLLPDQNLSLKTQKGSGKSVNVSWDLNNENGNQLYELQRSSNGEIFETIKTRNASGDNDRPVVYNYIDNDPEVPVSYYRIKVIRSEGPAKYSDISKVEFRDISAMSVIPNPARGFASLSLQSVNSGKGFLQIIDNSGRLICNDPVQIAKGTNDYYLPIIQKLSKGMYTIRVTINDEVITTNFMVLK